MLKLQKFFIHIAFIITAFLGFLIQSQGKELSYFTDESFQNAIHNSMTPTQEDCVFLKVKDYFSSFYFNKDDVLRHIAKDENVPLPGDYFVEFKNDDHHYKGIVDFSHRKTSSEYIFKMYVFRDPKKTIEFNKYRGTFTPDIKENTYDEAKFELLAGTAICSYNKEFPRILNLESFVAFPYKCSQKTKNKISINGEEIPCEGLVLQNLQNRLNDVYSFVGCFADEIAKVDRVILNNEKATLAPLILESLTTPGKDGTSYVQNESNPNIYELVIRNDEEESSSESGNESK